MLKIKISTIIVVLSLLVFSPFVLADDDDDDEYGDSGAAKSFVFDVKHYKVSDKSFRRASFKAFLKRGWSIEAVEINKIRGWIKPGGTKHFADITRKDSSITVAYVKQYRGANNRWLENLGRDVLTSLVDYED